MFRTKLMSEPSNQEFTICCPTKEFMCNLI